MGSPDVQIFPENSQYHFVDSDLADLFSHGWPVFQARLSRSKAMDRCYYLLCLSDRVAYFDSEIPIQNMESGFGGILGFFGFEYNCSRRPICADGTSPVIDHRSPQSPQKSSFKFPSSCYDPPLSPTLRLFFSATK
jgi:hypothetical protein